MYALMVFVSAFNVVVFFWWGWWRKHISLMYWLVSGVHLGTLVPYAYALYCRYLMFTDIAARNDFLNSWGWHLKPLPMLVFVMLIAGVATYRLIKRNEYRSATDTYGEMYRKSLEHNIRNATCGLEDSRRTIAKEVTRTLTYLRRIEDTLEKDKCGGKRKL